MDPKRVEKLRKTYFKLFAVAGMAHVVYVIIFGMVGIASLAVYNVFSVITYLCISIRSLSTNNIFNEIEVCLVEIIVFSLLGTLIMGNAVGFGCLFIGVLPIGYYVIYSLSENRKKSVIAVLILIAVFIVVSVLATLEAMPRKALWPEITWHIYLLNVIAGFFMLLVFFVEFMGLVQEDTKLLMQKNKKLSDEANYDQLTKLLNRRSYERCMDVCFENAQKGKDFSVVMFDIDDFKAINDTYGHSTGDTVLEGVAEAISSSIRPNDIAIRWGGEEILLIIQAGSNATYQTAERCRRAIEDRHFEDPDGCSIRVTATAGYCSYMLGMTKDAMIEIADKALYRGKHKGKNCVVHGLS